MSILLGVGAGLGAFVFRVAIAVVHNTVFLGRLSITYDATEHTPPSPWGHAIILGPVLGSLVVTLLVRTFAPEAKGHGVPEVMDAIYYGKGVIRPIVAVIKSAASAISIGTGGSVGREGPIVQISAAFASWLGGVARTARWQRATLVAAGGGAGIAATFNTPIGGVLFAVEVLMHEVSVRTLTPVLLATATATYIGERLFGNAPAFRVPPVGAPMTAQVLPAFVLVGALMAVVSVVFIRALYGAEDVFEKYIPTRPYVRHALGMLGVGITMDVVMTVTGHYYVQGVGYATIADLVAGRLSSGGLLVALFALKLLTTSLTLGSGGSGGVFSPSLFMGATLGAAFGLLLRALFPSIPFDPAALALAGMAGVVAGATGAALAATVMIFEMTGDYAVVLPMTLTVATSYGLRRLLLADNIYTMKLARRGHYMPDGLQANPHLVYHADELPLSAAVVVQGEVDPSDLARPDASPYFVLVSQGRVTGVLSRESLLAGAQRPMAKSTLEALARVDFVVAGGDEALFELIEQMQRARATLAVIRSASPEVHLDLRGVVSRSEILTFLAEGMELFSD